MQIITKKYQQRLAKYKNIKYMPVIIRSPDWALFRPEYIPRVMWYAAQEVSDDQYLLTKMAVCNAYIVDKCEWDYFEETEIITCSPKIFRHGMKALKEMYIDTSKCVENQQRAASTDIRNPNALLQLCHEGIVVPASQATDLPEIIYHDKRHFQIKRYHAKPKLPDSFIVPAQDVYDTYEEAYARAEQIISTIYPPYYEMIEEIADSTHPQLKEEVRNVLSYQPEGANLRYYFNEVLVTIPFREEEIPIWKQADDWKPKPEPNYGNSAWETKKSITK